MTTLALTRVDKEYHGEKWQIKLEGQSALLLMPDSQVAASFTPEEAFSQFELIRFARSGHNVAITAGENIWKFAAWPKAFKQINIFVQQSQEASSEAELASIRRRAIVQTALGSLILLAGIALTLDDYLKAAYKDGGSEYAIFYGAMVAGILLLVKGLYHFIEYRKLRCVADLVIQD
ncbi:MAG: hypothetical protein GY927_13370 [bacterium]|nr:hypothetical protein [bacterium]